MGNKTPYNPSPLNRNNNQMEGVKGFGFTPTAATFQRTKNAMGDNNKTFTRNHSRKRYRENSSDGNISEGYFKSFDSKRIKKKKKVTK